MLNDCRVVSITTLLLRQKVPCPYGSLEKGRAIGVNVGRELIIFADTVSGALWV